MPARRGALIGLISSTGQSVIKIKGAEACTRICVRILLRQGYILGRKEAPQEGVQINGFMAAAAPNDCALKAELKIACRLKADFLSVHPGIIRRGMSLEAAHEKVVSKWTSQPR